MRWLVTGAGGQLGHHVVARLQDRGADVVGLTRAQLDVCSMHDVDAAVRAYRPDVVVNAAAYTRVDAAEHDEAAATRVNGTGPALLADALAQHGGRLLHISTDYVFEGTTRLPYEPADRLGPTTAYGRSKLAGELAIRAVLPERSHVVRTAWLFGGPGPNFVDTMLRLEREEAGVDVVTDEVGSPTWAGDLAEALIELGSVSPPGGTLHFVNSGYASWFELAQETFRLVGADPERVRPVTAASYPRPAARPPWSVLSSRSWTALGLAEPRSWQAALAEALRER